MMRPQPSKETIGLQHLMIVEPLEFEVLAATVNEEVTIIDMIIEKESVEYFVQKISPDVFCVTGYISHVNIMKDYCKRAKQVLPSVVTVAGGVHLEKNPEHFESEWIDYRVVRNATREFPKLIEYLKNGAKFPQGVFKKEDREKTLPEHDFYYPIPKRELVQKYDKDYYYVILDKVALLKTSFGCPYGCTFCYCRSITDGKYVERDIDEVITELRGIWQENIYVIDDNFLVSAPRVNSFIEGVKKYNLKKRYLVYGRADFIAEHEELISELKDIGLMGIIVGIESFNDEELKNFEKRLTFETIDKAINILNNLNVEVFGTLITGPDWDVSDFTNMINLLVKYNIHYVNIQPLTPLPKTEFVVEKERLLLDPNEYEKWDLAQIVIKPGKLSVKDYYKQLKRSYVKVVLRFKIFLEQLKYPLKTQMRLFKGARRVYNQYQTRINNA